MVSTSKNCHFPPSFRSSFGYFPKKFKKNQLDIIKVLFKDESITRGNMGKFILCVSQHITNNVLRYVHRLKMLKNPNFATNTGWKNWKISFLLKTPVHFPEVQTPWNLNFRMNPAPQPWKPPRLFCQRNVIFDKHGFIGSWHLPEICQLYQIGRDLERL